VNSSKPDKFDIDAIFDKIMEFLRLKKKVLKIIRGPEKEKP
jgi:hypothetical protein